MVISDVQRRGIHRGQATKKIKSIEDLLSTTNIDTVELTVEIQLLKDEKSEIKRYDEIVLENIEEDQLNTEYDDIIKRQKLIDICLLKAETALGQFATANRHLSTTIQTSTQPIIKLPQVKLLFFKGNPIDWPSFWDCFESNIHKRTDLSGSQKFTYLIGQLEGPAAKLLSGFTLTNHNYVEAVDLLVDTYGKPEKIIISHLHTLLDISSPSHTAVDLDNFRSTFECHLRALYQLRPDIKNSGLLLSTILMRKLPIKVRENMSRASKLSLWEMDDFKKFLSDEIEYLRENEDRVKIDNNAGKRNSDDKAKLSKSTSGNFFSNSSSHKNSRQYKIKNCRFCNENHSTNSCVNFQSYQSRISRVKELKLCSNCLYDHGNNPCRSKYSCYFCSNKHHSSICPQKCKTTITNEGNSNNNNQGNSATASTVLAQAVDNQSIALPTALLNVKTKHGLYFVRTLFDQCAQRSMMLKKVADSFDLLKTKKVSLSIDGFSTTGKLMSYDCVELLVETEHGVISIEVILVDSLPSRVRIPGINNLMNKLCLKGIKLADNQAKGDCIEDIAILIGADFYYKFIIGHSVVDNIQLIDSNVGKMISGPIPYDHTESSNSSDKSLATDVITVMFLNSDDSIRTDFEKLWSMEAIGMQSAITDNDDFLNNFQDSLQFRDGKYIAKLPWKSDHPTLPTNYGMAKGILKSSLERLRKDPIKLKHYDDILRDQVKRGFIEKVEVSQEYSREPNIHYLPHHGVKKNSPTTPLRIVFNCSAGKVSLNDCLFTGPSMVPDLTHVLLRFRLNKYAAIGDIAKAFLMISLHESDRNSTRFLWPENPKSEKSRLDTYRFKVILFGSTSSQFILNATIDHHLRKNVCETAEMISRNIYVDNVVFTSNEEKRLLDFYQNSKAILSKANFHLKEWATNSPILKSNISENQDGISATEEFVNVLGLLWNPQTDAIGFRRQKFDGSCLTKRKVLSQASKIFDPLGYLTPVTIRGKLFLQKLWTEKLGWDEPLEELDQTNWVDIIEDINVSTEITFNRRINVDRKIDIHAFSDASKKAYCTAIYIVDGKSSHLAMAKTRLAPLSKITEPKMTVPKLELAAATLSARVIGHIVTAYNQELDIGQIHIWMDSTIAYYWITKGKSKNVFVRNRVQEINNLVPNGIWHYIPSEENPSDLATRGITAKKLSSSKLWFQGPDWILNPACWPTLQLEKKDAEVDVNSGDEQINACTIVSNHDCLIDYSRFGRKSKIIRVLVLTFRFVLKLKGRQTPSTDDGFRSHNITTEESRSAELFLIRDVQEQKFGNEFKALKNNLTSTNLIKQLHLFLQNDVIRCRGRIEHSQLEYDTKFPILLPSKHHVTNLYILSEHEKRFHFGIEDTMNSLRKSFWIPQMRQRVKSNIRKCVVCKKLQGGSYRIPPPPQLPTMRVSEAKPFQIIGLDYTGALHVKDENIWKKTYACLLTCTVTRAVHLELVPDNTTEAFLLAFRRFVGRRGLPKYIHSDNATTFLSASNTLNKIFNHHSVKDYFSSNKTVWHFIPKRAPWYGGYWERLIGLTKTALKKAIGRCAITSEELRTILVEIESILNDRPISHVSGNLEDVPALTPNQLIYGHRLITPILHPIEEHDEDYVTERILNKRQRRCASIIQSFWKRWHLEYLTSLRELSKKRSGSIDVKVGDIVLIHDEGPRFLWRLGCVEELTNSRDGHIRSVNLRTANGRTSRPVAKLFPLEINSNQENRINDCNEDLEEVRSPRLQRRAAKEAIVRIKNQFNH